MALTDSRTEAARSFKYDGNVLRITFTDQDWVEYDVNADNPQRAWVIRKTFSMYGGRCQSHIDFPLDVPAFDIHNDTPTSAQRQRAFAAMVVALAAEGVAWTDEVQA